MTTLTTDSAERKGIPLARGLLDYFPAALAEVARLSQAGNDKHNPGEELHHARGKSMDHADCILRHLVERGVVDTDGFLHDVKVAWRALANLQEALEARGAPIARGARLPTDSSPLPPRLDTWTPWHGETSHAPVHARTLVEVKLRNGGLVSGYRADILDWKHGLGDGDIVAWRHAQK
jgi:hypothetical protein